MVRKVSQPACAAQEALKGQSRAGGVLLVPLSLVIPPRTGTHGQRRGSRNALQLRINFDVFRGSLTQEVCHILPPISPRSKLDPRQL